MQNLTNDQRWILVRQQGMVDALVCRVDATAPPTQAGNVYRSMSLLEMGREFLEMHGVSTRGLSRMDLAAACLQRRSAGMQTTGDFAALLANVANKRLRAAYDEGPATYTLWARRAPDARDFRTMNVVQLSSAPSLLRTGEHGEFKYGTMTDSGETYAVVTFGRLVSLSRQAMVNDDLRGFDRMLQAFGAAARRLENALVYSQLTDNAALSDGGALFNATAVTTAGGHANLATGGGSVLGAAALNTGRAAMRLQRGLQSEVLNIAPAFLIVPATLEQTAYQYTSSQYVPATPGSVNEFRAGGRTALEPIVEPILDGVSTSAWYMAANSRQVDTVEYCYLDGATGPVIESKAGFDVDGVSFKCRLDFGAKALDFRGLYKGAGA